MRGEVKRLKEGFGFIRGEDGIDYFFHRTGLQQTGRQFEELEERMPVTFTPVESLRGPRAIEILAEA